MTPSRRRDSWSWLRSPWTALVLTLAFLLLQGALNPALAHGVAEGDKGYIQEISGINILPFLYLGVDYHPDYHRPSDDFEKITPAVFQNSTELAIAAFRALDRSLDR